MKMANSKYHLIEKDKTVIIKNLYSNTHRSFIYKTLVHYKLKTKTCYSCLNSICLVCLFLSKEFCWTLEVLQKYFPFMEMIQKCLILREVRLGAN